MACYDMQEHSDISIQNLIIGPQLSRMRNVLAIRRATVYAATKNRKKTADNRNNDNGDRSSDNSQNPAALLGLRVSRNGLLIATITATTLTVWRSLV